MGSRQRHPFALDQGEYNLKDYLALWYMGTVQPSLSHGPTPRAASPPAAGPAVVAASPPGAAGLPVSSGGLPADVTPQWVENCLGFGCGQCHSARGPHHAALRVCARVRWREAARTAIHEIAVYGPHRMLSKGSGAAPALALACGPC